MKISLMGYMGSGKSTLGQYLAQELNLPFYDLDSLIEQTYQKSISEIFAQNGEIKFRKYEKELLHQSLETDSSFVFSLGGGTPAYYNNIETINSHSFSIYLRLSPMEIFERLKNEKEKRPIIAHLDDEQLVEFIAKHLFERRHFYEQAQLVLDVKKKTIEELVEEIKNHPLLPLQ